MLRGSTLTTGLLPVPKDAAVAIEVLRQAVDQRVRFFDTANAYGPRTVNQIIGRALSAFADDIVIGNKVGARRDAAGGWLVDSRPETVRTQVEDALPDEVALRWSRRNRTSGRCARCRLRCSASRGPRTRRPPCCGGWPPGRHAAVGGAGRRADRQRRPARAGRRDRVRRHLGRGHPAAVAGRGIYRALTAARARSALALGKRLMHSDSTEFFRPILERAGLVKVSATTPYTWRW
jgi:hypothetical protein